MKSAVHNEKNQTRVGRQTKPKNGTSIMDGPMYEFISHVDGPYDH